MIYPVILAGGSGTRLWPVSRESYPKQFADLLGGPSLFQRTIERMIAPGIGAPTVVTAEAYRFIAQNQLNDIQAPAKSLIVEPAKRNTAAAVLTAAIIHKDQPDAVLAVLPSDHMITDERAFHRTFAMAARIAEGGMIVTLGVQPETPTTEFGYLKIDGGSYDALSISRFLEKPDQEMAKKMVSSGEWLWNSGIFLFRVDTILKAYETHAPELIGPVEAAVALGSQDLGFQRLDPASYERCQDISFDRAIMENLQQCAAVPLDCGWSDLGSWDAIKTSKNSDSQGNVAHGNATALDCKDSLLRSENPDIKLVGLGLKNVIAVATEDGVLIADKNQSGNVGNVVETLRIEGAPQANGFRRSYRPWGYYEVLSMGDRFQVKRIMVLPGAKLSLQSHMHRAEHWVVVSGSAQVTVDHEEQLLSENESTYIPLGAVHRLENPGKVPLHLIEVQSGAYLGEDDITRYEDIYQRGESA